MVADTQRIQQQQGPNDDVPQALIVRAQPA
jgi:hypothetical protein